MLSPSNRLTAAQAERIAHAIEEMSEAIQVLAKILRHGYKPEEFPIDNKAELERELGDVRASMLLLCKAGDVSKEAIHAQAEKKLKSPSWIRQPENIALHSNGKK